MRSKSKTALVALTIVAVALAVAGAAALYFAMTEDFDFSIRHFNTGSVNCTAAVGICCACAVLGIAGAIICSKKLSFDNEVRHPLPGVFVSVLAGLMCLLYLYRCVKEGLPDQKRAFSMIKIAFTALSALFFFVRASGVIAKRPALGLTGLIPAFMQAFMLLEYYFKDDEPINSPLKIYTAVMLVSFMLFFTAESGVSIKKPGMNRKFAFAGLAAISAGGMVCFSMLAVRILDVDEYPFDVVTLILFAVIWLYTLVAFLEKLLPACEKFGGGAFFDDEAAGAEDEATDKDAEDKAAEAEEAVENEAYKAEDAAEEIKEEIEDAAKPEKYGE